MQQHLPDLTAVQLVDLYRRRAVSPVEVVSAVLDRAHSVQQAFNAFVVLLPEQALSEARASEQRWLAGCPMGPADGVPVTVKDLLMAAGAPVRRGSAALAQTGVCQEDSASVARLREAGAIVIGKTTTSEFGWKGVTDSPLTGITRNPWNPALTPGGSSGGAAAAAAAGVGPLHLATDGGGSIRIPASFCGLFGFKPTFGVVPVHPHPPALTLWHQGPVSRTVEDAAFMLDIISRPDRRDFYAAPHVARNFLDPGIPDIAGLRVAYAPRLGGATVDEAVARQVDHGVGLLRELGCEVTTVDPDLEDPIGVMRPLWAVALAMAVDGVPPERRGLLDPGLEDLAAEGLALTAVDYRKLERLREDIARQLDALHDDYHILVTPQVATLPFAVGCNVPPGSGLRHWWQWSPFTYPFNLSQQPAATIPCGVTAGGLPVGMQVVARRFDDRLLVRVARAVETLQPFEGPPLQK
jgi:aspartyl-tRNA(Asn)/glutamyl-tRNA(Gln) amidotransferase subunit A